MLRLLTKRRATMSYKRKQEEKNKLQQRADKMWREHHKQQIEYYRNQQ